MNQALFHRGPDSDGYFMDSHIALTMRRLKIIDLSGGDQPLYNEDSSLVLIANAEIYNYVELRKDLEQMGHSFKTRSDCETILRLYEEKSELCLYDLRGIFAFVLYDKRQGKLFLARDRLGEKPIYYYQNESIVVFFLRIKISYPVSSRKRS